MPPIGKGFTIFGFIVMILLAILVSFLYRTVVYKNYLKDCSPDTKFCYIQKIKLDLPNELYEPLMTLSRYEGSRIDIPKKRQKAIQCKVLEVKLPTILEWYKSLPPIVSEIVGDELQCTPVSEPNSLCLVVYEKEGDYIDWHFDTNHYKGRYFTLLVPVSMEPTCGNYQYKDANETVQEVMLERGDAILFEGDKVFHRGKELCKNQTRVILSCTFCTTTEMAPVEAGFHTLKNFAFFGGK
jgi:hypothetical protein